ncbi:hypothetical protein AB1Y20_009804 [Prymnesium parvum]|uniref:Uncharacterized protein n=1 Tax=Prymnesium parvum TaxID=97485 RepID=A0AB34K7L5_PRYPA|mmetsp:Transcript_18380/g.46025  ORF Transcript_18380/g.46025 Transcript_18380/m.46025 type:complete len:293 (-) Transcript_18380:399-1277(-)
MAGVDARAVELTATDTEGSNSWRGSKSTAHADDSHDVESGTRDVAYISTIGDPAPRPVVSFPISIQSGFRWKLLMLLFLQLVFVSSLAAALRWGCTATLESVFHAQSTQTVLLFVAVVCSLPILALIKHMHPYNLIFTTIWSFFFAVFVAASDLPDSFFRSHALFHILFQLTAGVALLLITSQLRRHNHIEGEIMWRFSHAGVISWTVYMTIAIVVYVMCLQDVTSPGPFVTASVLSTAVFAWVCYDAAQLCQRMSPDEYLHGVIHFYTDLFFICCCCAFLSCLASSTTDAQ